MSAPGGSSAATGAPGRSLGAAGARCRSSRDRPIQPASSDPIASAPPAWRRERRRQSSAVVGGCIRHARDDSRRRGKRDEPAQDPDPGDGLDAGDGGTEDEDVVRIAQGRGEARSREGRKDARGDVRTGRREAAEPGPDPERDENDEDLERDLVVLAEERDDEVLRAGRLDVDDEPGDGQEWRWGAEEAREQLARAERGAHRHGAREREPPADPGRRFRPIRHRAGEPTAGCMTGR